MTKSKIILNSVVIIFKNNKKWISIRCPIFVSAVLTGENKNKIWKIVEIKSSCIMSGNFKSKINAPLNKNHFKSLSDTQEDTMSVILPSIQIVIVYLFIYYGPSPWHHIRRLNGWSEVGEEQIFSNFRYQVAVGWFIQ